MKKIFIIILATFTIIVSVGFIHQLELVRESELPHSVSVKYLNNQSVLLLSLLTTWIWMTILVFFSSNKQKIPNLTAIIVLTSVSAAGLFFHIWVAYIVGLLFSYLLIGGVVFLFISVICYFRRILFSGILLDCNLLFLSFFLVFYLYQVGNWSVYFINKYEYESSLAAERRIKNSVFEVVSYSVDLIDDSYIVNANFDGEISGDYRINVYFEVANPEKPTNISWNDWTNNIRNGKFCNARSTEKFEGFLDEDINLIFTLSLDDIFRNCYSGLDNIQLDEELVGSLSKSDIIFEIYRYSGNELYWKSYNMSGVSVENVNDMILKYKLIDDEVVVNDVHGNEIIRVNIN